MKSHMAFEVTPKLAGKEVTLGGWVTAVRAHGAITFMILRDSTGTVQVTAKKGDVSDNLLQQIAMLGREWAVLVSGKVRESKQAPRGVEIIPDSIDVLGKAPSQLPLDPNVKANLDTRLDWRYLDFRMPKTSAIFKIQTKLLEAFRSFFLEKNFMEMQPPCIISSASEGGAELFAIPYFEKEAFLAQSPQLYKQMGAISFEKVFMTVPVFRAEKHDQPTHLNEIRQMDAEIGFATDKEALEWLENVFVHMLKKIKEECAAELELLGRDIKIPKLPLPRVTYTEAINALKEKGEIIQWGEDFTKTQEKMLTQLFGEAFFMTDWPSEIRAFYSMPYEDNPSICKAYDLIYGGIEIASGAQRIHIPELLEKRLKEKGLNPANFEYYINAFRFGAPPHAGWSIGLERLTMIITGVQNVREACMFPRDRNRLTP